MDIFLDVVQSITDNLFSQVSLLIGLIALVGLVLQRKPVEEVVAGTLRATIGVIVLNIGVGIFVAGLVSFQAIVSSAMGLEPPTATSTLAEFTAGAGSVVPLIIAGGFVVHLVLVRVFPAARFVYLTGHLMYWMAVVIAASLVEAFGDVDRWTLAGAGALMIGCYWVLQPLWTGPLMRKVMGDDEVGLAHTMSTIALAAGYGSRALRLGDPVRHDAERLRLPKAISFFKDINVSTAFVIGVIMLVAIAFADQSVVAEQVGDTGLAPWVWGLLQALQFAGGIAILLFGVRMFLAEIVPAFKGLSERALPGTKPALDIPVTFTKAPTSVMVGFLAATIVFLVLMGVFALAGWFVLVPPMIMLFFGGGAGGVFGNAAAGWRGAAFGGALTGIVLAFGQWLSWNLYGSTAPELATLADADWFAVGWLIIGLGSLLGGLGTAGVWIIAGATVVVTIVVLLLVGRRAPVDAAVASPALVHAGAPTGGQEAAAGESEAAVEAAPARARAASGAAARPSPLTVLAVCGAGMGSSLILRTTAERALADLGIEAVVTHTDAGSARGATADLVIAQPTYLSELGDLAPVMVSITSFVDVPHVRERIEDGLHRKGWL